MIVEQALLQVKPGRSDAFRQAMGQARPVIARQAGFQSLAVHPAIDRPDHYLLLVVWDTVEAHRDGFRQSADYQQWRDLLHEFYDPMPQITYFGPSLFP